MRRERGEAGNMRKPPTLIGPVTATGLVAALGVAAAPAAGAQTQRHHQGLHVIVQLR